ncbi:MAG: hypothetical protein WA631_11020 [Nitrososphaeraceae archaeon]
MSCTSLQCTALHTKNIIINQVWRMLNDMIKSYIIVYGEITLGLLLLLMSMITGMYQYPNQAFAQNIPGMGGMSSMGGGGSMGGMNMPGTLHEMCHMGNDMPPHYCLPSYNVMSSVQGVKVSAVSPLNNNSLDITLQQLNTMSNATTTQKIVVVGGGGNLAGGTIVNPDWKTNTQVHLKLQGSDSIYDLSGIHIHLFPYTG